MSISTILLIVAGVIILGLAYVLIAVIYGFATLPFKIAYGETREWKRKQKERKKSSSNRRG